MALIRSLLTYLNYFDFCRDLPDYPNTTNSRRAADSINFLTEKSTYCRDAYTVAQYFALGRLIRNHPTISPSCYKIKYVPFHVWCSRKGHSDTGSQQKSMIAPYFQQDAATYLAIRLLDSQTLNFWKIARLLNVLSELDSTDTLANFRRKMSRHLTLREFLTSSSHDFNTAFDFSPNLTSSSQIPTSSAHPPPLKHRGLAHFEVLRLQTEYETAYMEAWNIFKLHLPSVLGEDSLHCAIPGCNGRTRWGCKECYLRLCWSKSKDSETEQEVCWSHLHLRVVSMSSSGYSHPEEVRNV